MTKDNKAQEGLKKAQERLDKHRLEKSIVKRERIARGWLKKKGDK